MEYDYIPYHGHYAVVDSNGEIQCEVDSVPEAKAEIQILETTDKTE